MVVLRGNVCTEHRYFCAQIDLKRTSSICRLPQVKSIFNLFTYIDLYKRDNVAVYNTKTIAFLLFGDRLITFSDISLGHYVVYLYIFIYLLRDLPRTHFHYQRLCLNPAAVHGRSFLYNMLCPTLPNIYIYIRL